MSNHLSTCHEGLTLKSSFRQAPFTPRRAVHPDARFGSIYDARCDQIMRQQIQPLHVAKMTTMNYPPSCSVKEYTTDDTFGILKMMNLHQELRLSIALQMIPAHGIAAIYNYDQPINQYTRIMSYNVITRTDYLPDDQLDSYMAYRPQNFKVSGTHVVILINYGIDAFIIIQLPPDDYLANRIDQVLRWNCNFLHYGNILTYLNEQEQLLKQIVHTKVFSNVPSLSEMTSMIEFYRNIDRFRNNTNLHCPYNYNLCPFNMLFSTSAPEQMKYCEIPESSITRIEATIRQFKKKVIRLEKAITQEYPYCHKHLRNFKQDINEPLTSLKTIHERALKQIAEHVKAVRSGTMTEASLLETVINQSQDEFQTKIHPLYNRITEKDLKEGLLRSLESRQITYSHASDNGIASGDDFDTIQMKVKRTHGNVIILCANDPLYSQDCSQWNDQCSRLLEHCENNPKMQCLYLDFTGHPYKLQQLRILHSESTKNESASGTSSIPTGTEGTQQEYDTVNILLFGETGVGKSTFINALVNYLRFDTFRQADNKKPIVLLPISFMLTSGHEFTEHHVNYPGIDTQSDEQHDQLGQSVTQHCRSYLFTIKDDQQRDRRVRLIDTPGISDTRGLGQDEKNMQDILMFINGLSQLHAICIVLKPNVTRLDIMFRTCLSQLLDMLGDDVRDHIMFCFTNTRSTFYAPGDTGPLLTKFLAEVPVKNIKLKKENTFCFDSESFRYLVAKQKGVPFDADETEQFRKTWDRSSVEANRFLSSIVRKTTVYGMGNSHRSVGQAQLEITLLIRPLMEAIRNLLRNIILTEKQMTSNWIELQPKKLGKYATLCHRCPLKIKECAGFTIAIDEENESHKACPKCSCPSDCHTVIHYLLDYKERNASSKPSHAEWRTDLMILCQTCVMLGCFLSKTNKSKSKDRFLVYLEKMMEEEERVSTQTSKYIFNRLLISELKKVKGTYEDMMKDQMKVDGEPIAEWIEKAETHALVQSQWKTVESWWKSMVNRQEFQIPSDIIIR